MSGKTSHQGARLKILRWTARISALALLAFGLPFYFGYGNPLPFVNPANSVMDNIFLTIFPLMFIGLGLGWFFEKTGGWLVSLSVGSGLVLGLVIKQEMVSHMLVPLAVGLLFLAVGYSRKK